MDTNLNNKYKEKFSKMSLSEQKMVKQWGKDLHKSIKANNMILFQQEIQRICGIIVIKDELIEEDLINFIKQNKMETYGNYEVRASGKTYFVDYEEEDLKTEDVITSCGAKVKVQYVVCREPFKSQIPNDYIDTLSVNIRKNLTIALRDAEIRMIACGENTYLELVNLVRSKIQEAKYDLIYNEIVCRLNDASAYKQIVTLPYCCNICEGKSKRSALYTFAYKLRRNTADYNIQGRDYNLNLNSMYLIQSPQFTAEQGDIMSRAFDPSLISLTGLFARIFTLDINLADVIILSKNALQVQEVLDRVTWYPYDGVKRRECGVANYDARIKLLNFEVAVPIKFVNVSCEVKKEADLLSNKIENLNTVYQVTDEADAQTQIKADIEKLKAQDTKLSLEYEFLEYSEPTDTADGSIKVAVNILDEQGLVVSSAHNLFVLKKKQ